MMLWMRRTIPVLLAVAATAAGCGGDERTSATEEPPIPPPTTEEPIPPDRSWPGGARRTPPSVASRTPRTRPTPHCTGTTRSLAGRGVAAVLRRPATAHRAPGGAVTASFDLVNLNGVPTTFRVLGARLGPDCRPAWYRVQLPIRPNGIEGWVRAPSVRRYTVRFRIVVDLSDRAITVYRGGRQVVRTRTAIGRSETPTPTGSFYVNQRLLASDPGGPWGPGGIGISAFSPVLTSWTQGGPIAIHGTNQPHTIGLAASNGCMRIANDVLQRLIYLIPDGTPVRIRA